MAELVPSVFLHRGRIVSGPSKGVLSKNPVEYMNVLFERFGKALIFDLDGILRNKPHWSVLKQMEGKDVWVDAGVRYFEGIFEPFMTGASNVVLSTSRLKGLMELEKAFELSENIMFRVELEDEGKKVRGRGFQMPLEDLFHELQSMGIRKLIFSGEVSSIPLDPHAVDAVERILGMQAEHFEIYLVLPKDRDESRLERMNLKGVITGVEELV